MSRLAVQPAGDTAPARGHRRPGDHIDWDVVEHQDDRPVSDAGPGAFAFTAAEIRALHHGFRDFMVRQTFGSKPALSSEFHVVHAKLVSFVRETKTCAPQPQSTPSAAEELIDTTEAAAILNCSPQWVGRIRDKLGVRDIGSQRVFPRQTVVQYAARKAGQHR
jgi:hypothetical protein